MRLQFQYEPAFDENDDFTQYLHLLRSEMHKKNYENILNHLNSVIRAQITNT